MKEYVDLMMNCIKDFKLSSLASLTNFKYPEKDKIHFHSNYPNKTCCQG